MVNGLNNIRNEVHPDIFQVILVAFIMLTLLVTLVGARSHCVLGPPLVVGAAFC